MNLNEVLKWLGWLSIAGGIIGGLIIANTSQHPSNPTVVAITWIISGIASGVIFFAISRALELLEVIAENTQPAKKPIVTSSASPTNSIPSFEQIKASVERI